MAYNLASPNGIVEPAVELLLKSALAILGSLRLRDDRSRHTLRRFNHVLELVAAPAFDRRSVPELPYSRLNAHYREAVEWARLILRSGSPKPGTAWP